MVCETYILLLFPYLQLAKKSPVTEIRLFFSSQFLKIFDRNQNFWILWSFDKKQKLSVPVVNKKMLVLTA